MRRAVRVMDRTLSELGLRPPPDKTVIGKLERGFDFLGVDIRLGQELRPSKVSRNSLQKKSLTNFQTRSIQLERFFCFLVTMHSYSTLSRGV